MSLIKDRDPFRDAVEAACKILKEEANNLSCSSTYEEVGIKRSQIPWRAGHAIQLEIHRLREIAETLEKSIETPNETAQRRMQLERIAEWSESAMTADCINDEARQAFEQINDEASREAGE